MKVVKDDATTPIVSPPETIEPTNWQREAHRKLMEAREELRKQKFEKEAEYYNGKLNDLINLYFSYYSEDNDENTVSFNALNAQWMDLVHKANATQKVIHLNHDGFSKKCKRNYRVRRF